MNDLRESGNPEAHAIDERTHYNLRTVKMPNLRDPHDCTPWTERTDARLAAIEAAIERIADKVTQLLLERDL